MTTTRIEWESLDQMLESGLDDLVHAHWEEVGVHKAEMPVSVDWERYADLETKGILKLMGARLKGRLIGYSSFFYLPHLHYQTTALAGNDAIYVLKRVRGAGAGIRMIDMAQEYFTKLAAPGWCRITYHDRAGVELLGPVLRKRGYIATDTTYSRMVRAEV